MSKDRAKERTEREGADVGEAGSDSRVKQQKESKPGSGPPPKLDAGNLRDSSRRPERGEWRDRDQGKTKESDRRGSTSEKMKQRR